MARMDISRKCAYSGDTIGYSNQYQNGDGSRKGDIWHGEKGKMVHCFCGRTLRVTQAGYGGSATLSSSGGISILPDEDKVATTSPVWDDDDDLMAKPDGEVTYHQHKHCAADSEYWFEYGFNSAKREAEMELAS